MPRRGRRRAADRPTPPPSGRPRTRRPGKAQQLAAGAAEGRQRPPRCRPSSPSCPARSSCRQLQKTRNQQALARWQTYLTELGAANVRAPAAAALQEPGAAAGRDDRGGRGRARPSAVSPRCGPAAGRCGCSPTETIRAVNKAFSLLGKPYGVAATGPDQYGCLGAARVAWQPYTTLPNLVGKVYPDYQAVPNNAVQPGDLLVIGSKTVGLFHIGVALGDGEMIASDEGKGSVVVTAVPDNLYATLRPTLGSPAKAQVAPQPPTRRRLPLRQHRDVVQRRFAAPGPGRWPDGTYEIGTPFGQPGAMWSTGVHTGQDFPAAIGTPVGAVTAGVVRVEHPAWAGNLVRIDHGNGLETLYAHLSADRRRRRAAGQAGQQIGAVGTEGNSTGPHLHFEVRLGGDPVNPMPFLATGSRQRRLGRLQQRHDPVEQAVRDRVGPHAPLRRGSGVPVACRRTSAVRQALCITDSYRSYASQVDLYARSPPWRPSRVPRTTAGASRSTCAAASSGSAPAVPVDERRHRLRLGPPVLGRPGRYLAKSPGTGSTAGRRGLTAVDGPKAPNGTGGADARPDRSQHHARPDDDRWEWRRKIRADPKKHSSTGSGWAWSADC